MSLASQVSSAFTRVGTEFKAVRAGLGANTDLTTGAKGTLVAAINEVNAKPTGTGGAAINDAAAGTTTTYSSTKTQNVADASALALIVDTSTATTKTWSAAKTQAAANAAALALISDSAASATKTYSSNKIAGDISAAVASLVNSAPAALDTLAELSTALGGDANFATTTAAALGNRLRFDAVQTLTTPQATQGRANLGVLSAVDVGDPNTDFVAVFNTALV